ncbi:MAG TPA: molybdopterin dinucleotide binding domain-containing protein, partial [Aeromicrobium sp.]|nr:molybdopterin dinucleotide binding domain-containing protein [Aeromicrobium sp.]
AAADYAPESVEMRTGVPAADVRILARALAGAPTAAVHGRTGACLGRHATLVNVLIDALNLVTGNLDRPGGLVFGSGPVDLATLAKLGNSATYDTYRSRVSDLPEVIGQLPAPLMAEEIETPGPGQLRALIVSAGNPVLSVPGAERFERALGTLDLQVAIDFYLNETHRHADYVLPAATFYERDDVVVAALDFHLTPFIQWTDAVTAPRGEAKPDWQIIDALGKEMGIRPVAGLPAGMLGTGRAAKLAARVLSPATAWVTPERAIDLLLRTGRHRLSVATLRKHPRGMVLAEHVSTGVLRRKARGGKVRLDDPRIADALLRLAAEPAPDPEYPVMLIGKRDVRSQNSWMHNTPKHRDAQRRQRALISPKDAAELGIDDGDSVRIISVDGVLEVPVHVTDDVGTGTIAVPHGWGHRGGGWTVANAAGGVNINEITPASAATLEPLSGMAHLNGIPVRLEAAVAQAGTG